MNEAIRQRGGYRAARRAPEPPLWRGEMQGARGTIARLLNAYCGYLTAVAKEVKVPL